jgi:hypothetical protein
VQVLEFIELEQTAKNVLIRAVRRPERSRRRNPARYLALKRALGIDPALEQLLADRLPLRG